MRLNIANKKNIINRYHVVKINDIKKYVKIMKFWGTFL